MDELLLERPRGQEAMEIGAQQFSHEVAASVSISSRPPDQWYVHILEGGNENIAQADDLQRKSVSRRLGSASEGDPRSRVGDASAASVLGRFAWTGPGY